VNHVKKKTKTKIPRAKVARTTRCPGARSAQEVTGGVRDSSVTSCAPTEVSVNAPGQQVVRATHEKGASGRSQSQALQAYWRDVKTGNRVRDEKPAELPRDPAANPLLDLPEGERAKLYVILRDCPLMETVNMLLQERGHAPVTREQFDEFFAEEGESHWEVRTLRAVTEANSLVRLARRYDDNIPEGILTALGQTTFRLVASGADPATMTRLATLFFKARSDHRATETHGLKRRKAEHELGDDVQVAFRKLAEEVDGCPAAQEPFDALQRALAEKAEGAE